MVLEIRREITFRNILRMRGYGYLQLLLLRDSYTLIPPPSKEIDGRER